MPDAQPPAPEWCPVSRDSYWSLFGRALSFPAYPALMPYAAFSYGEATVAGAKWWRTTFIGLGLAGGVLGHVACWKKTQQYHAGWHALSQVAWFLVWDHPYLWMTWIAHELINIFNVDREGCRLNRGELKGPNVLVVGNGPSAMQGEPLGDKIDKFDEVVRFNNFHTKVSGMEKFVGTKTTVHFSDGVLFPTYTEYHCPGADVILSLFSDRFMVAGSYVVLRAGADLQYRLTMRFLKDPKLIWIEKHDIERLKKAIGLTGVKHPTSGILGIDYFINKPGVKLPVYIHGFDFFQGPTIHYYNDVEPLYERINNRIGVNMHSPHLEKIYVEKLVREGKVKFLKDGTP